MKVLGVRAEETKRAITIRITHDGHTVSVTLSASCQEIGSAAAVDDVFRLVSLVVRERLGAEVLDDINRAKE